MEIWRDYVSTLKYQPQWMDTPFTPENPKITLVGEAPAREECAMGQPFVGASGLILDCALYFAGMDREDVCITNVFPFTLKRNAKPPLSIVDSIAAPKLKEFIVDNNLPKVVVALGAYALRAFHHDNQNLLDKAGMPILTQDDFIVIPTVHPSNVVDALFSDQGDPGIFWYIVLALRSASRIAEKGDTNIYYEPEMPDLIVDIAGVGEFLASSDQISLDFEGTHTNPFLSKSPLCVAMSNGNRTIVVPFRPWYPEWGVFFRDFVSSLEDYSGKLIMHNLLYDYVLLRAWGYKGKSPDVDTMVLLHSIYEYLPKSLKFASTFFCNFKPYSFRFSDLRPFLEGKTSFDEPHTQYALVRLLQYCGTDALATFKLYEVLNDKADERSRELYFQYYHPLLLALADVTCNGIPLNMSRVQELRDRLQCELDELNKEICDELNISSATSNAQLRDALKDVVMRYGIQATTAAGNISLNKSVLKELASRGVKVAEKLLDFRKRNKIFTTYVDSYPSYVDDEGLIHTQFGLTKTGRLRSSDPALQTLPRKSPILALFTAEQGDPPYEHIIIKGDYSAAEYRLLAYFSGLTDLLRPDLDIHRMIASFFFGIPYDEVTPDLRQKAKNLSFGVIYGASSQRVATLLGCSVTEAEELLNVFFSKFPSIKEQYMRSRELQVSNKGYSEVPGIRIRRHFPIELAMYRLSRSSQHLSPSTDQLGRRALFKTFRESYNLSCQGGVAVITNKALTRLNHELKRCSLRSRLCLQIHDALICISHCVSFVKTLELMRDIMCSPLLFPDLIVPVDFAIGWDLLNTVEIIPSSESIKPIDWDKVLERLKPYPDLFDFVERGVKSCPPTLDMATADNVAAVAT